MEDITKKFNYVKVYIVTHHILRIASAITLDISTSHILSIYSVTAGLIITN